MSSRNEVYKMPGLKFVSSAKATVQRIDEQNENRETARQAKNNAKRRLAEIDPNVRERALFLVPEVTTTTKMVEAASSTTMEQPSNRVTRSQTKSSVETEKQCTVSKNKTCPLVTTTTKMVGAASSTTTEQPSNRVTRSQTKRSVETEKQCTVTKNKTFPLKREMKNSNKENESFVPQGFVVTAPKEITVKDIEFQDSIHVQSTESDLPSRTPKRTSVEAESEDNIKISPLIFNHPWISTTRGSSSKNLKVTDVEKEFAELGMLEDAWVHSEDVTEVNKKPGEKGSGKRQSLKRRSVLFNLAKNSVFTVTDAILEEPDEFTPTTSHKKTFSRRVENVVESISPEKHLSGAVDAVKSETECFDRVTPLKVFLSPRESIPRNIKSKVLQLDSDEPAVQEISILRRSARLRSLNSIVPK